MTGTGRQWDWTADGWTWSPNTQPQPWMKQTSEDRNGIRIEAMSRDIIATHESALRKE